MEACWQRSLIFLSIKDVDIIEAPRILHSNFYPHHQGSNFWEKVKVRRRNWEILARGLRQLVLASSLNISSTKLFFKNNHFFQATAEVKNVILENEEEQTTYKG